MKNPLSFIKSKLKWTDKDRKVYLRWRNILEIVYKIIWEKELEKNIVQNNLVQNDINNSEKIIK